MSYQSKKKKTKLNKVIYLIRLNFVKVLNKINKKRGNMLMPNRQDKITTVIQRFSRISKGIRENNPNIYPWVGDYLRECRNLQQPVTIFTPCCVAKDLELRYEKQGNQFIPTEAEVELFRKGIPRIIRILQENGLLVDWFFSFNQSFLDMGRVDKGLKDKFKAMIKDLAGDAKLIGQEAVDLLAGGLEIIDWEEDVLGERPGPNQAVMNDFWTYIKEGAFEIDFAKHRQWTIDAELGQTEAKTKNDLKFKIACEVEEGRLLMSGESLVGPNFLYVSLEEPERIDVFSVLAPEFRTRVVTVLKPYPWRLPKDE